MNLRADIDLMLAGRPDWPACLFFRPADVIRLEGGVAALLGQGQSLALSCSAPAALDHYADLLIRRLRQRATCPVETYFPASTSALVARFDEMLSAMTVQQAMESGAQLPPERIWLVHDAGALTAAELQLLTRLVGSFPGAGVRVVLLFGPGPSARKGFETLGRRFSRWEIELPTAAEADAMREHAAREGGTSIVAQLLEPLLAAMPVPARSLVSAELATRVEPASPPSAEPARPRWRRWLPALRRSSRAGVPAATEGGAPPPVAAGASGLRPSLRLLGVGVRQLLRELRLAGGRSLLALLRRRQPPVSSNLPTSSKRPRP